MVPCMPSLGTSLGGLCFVEWWFRNKSWTCWCYHFSWFEWSLHGYSPSNNLSVTYYTCVFTVQICFFVNLIIFYFSVKNGVFRQYRGTRDKDEFISFVEEKKWEQVEPIPGWKSPSSIQMSIVSGFFKLSMMLRNIHTQITEEHGIPYWGSYLLFALATIIVGAVLGLVLVFLIDCFYPAKVAVKKSDLNASKKNEKVSLIQQPIILLWKWLTKRIF